MTPRTFPEAEDTLTAPSDMTEADCGPLDVYRDEVNHRTISCWRPSWRERLAMLVYGRVWVYVHAGGSTQPPIALSAARTVFVPQSVSEKLANYPRRAKR